MLDETTTVQNQKQMDILLRYWDKDEKQIVTKYLTSLLFTRVKALDVTNMVLNFHHNKKFELPWSNLCNERGYDVTKGYLNLLSAL